MEPAPWVFVGSAKLHAAAAQVIQMLTVAVRHNLCTHEAEGAVWAC